MPGAPSQAAIAARLERLEAYLREDPVNAELLADACDTAIAAGLHERARVHLDAAQRLALDTGPWLWRRARLALAQRDLTLASGLLEKLHLQLGPHLAVDHDRAYVHFLQQDFEACLALLRPWLDEAAAAEDRDALQALWLRAMHAGGRVDEAWDWANSQMRAGSLHAGARGVASLIAVDADDFNAAKVLSEEAIADHPAHPEALVARATVALAERDGAAADRWLEQALQQNPEDGRTWSMRGLASLQAQQLALAQSQLERAVVLMPGHIGSWHALGWSRLLQQNVAGAHKAFEQALTLDGNFAESHGALGLLLALQGDALPAERHLAIAARLDPSNVTGRFAQALLRGEAGDAERLQALVQRLLDRPGPFGERNAETVPRHMRKRAG